MLITSGVKWQSDSVLSFSFFPTMKPALLFTFNVVSIITIIEKHSNSAWKGKEKVKITQNPTPLAINMTFSGFYLFMSWKADLTAIMLAGPNVKMITVTLMLNYFLTCTWVVFSYMNLSLKKYLINWEFKLTSWKLT